MKPIVTALGICAFLFLVGAGEAADWQGDERDGNWGRAGNWSPANVPDDCTSESATITSKVTHWPLLDGDYKILSLTMNNGAELDMDNGTARTLSVDGTFSIGANGATLGGSGGTIRAETWSIGGVISLGEGTYECGAVTCP